jgi:hypothetical protein
LLGNTMKGAMVTTWNSSSVARTARRRNATSRVSLATAWRAALGGSERLLDAPDRHTVRLVQQGLADMGGKPGFEPMQRLTTDYYCTEMPRLRCCK